ncbi:MAG TPA: GAP family protein [Solirubrobacteraceae bacterium]|nr:GAP family protein [Solirubrobacteraceae bacterium]
MLKLAVAVVAIALADCINPSLIGGELFVATGERPRQSTIAFTVAAWIVTFMFGLALALGLGDLILALVPKPGRMVKYGLITAAGAVLVVGGAMVWIRRRSLVDGEASDDHHDAHRPAALMGAGIAGLELLTAFPYFAAIAMIVGSGVSSAERLLLLILYCVIYTLPLIAIAVLIAVMGERAERILGPIGHWLSGHWPAVVAPLTVAFGIGVLAFGIVQLTST